MNDVLVAGCAVAGAAIGYALYPWAAAVPPARTAAEREDPLTPTAVHLGAVGGGAPADEAGGALADPATPATIDAGRPSVAVPGAPTAGRPAVDTGPGDSGPGEPMDLVGAVEPESEPAPEDLPPAEPLPARTAERVAMAAATALLLGLAAARIGAVAELGAYCVGFIGLVLVSVVDLRVTLVPRKMLYPALALQSLGLLGAAIAQNTWRAFGDAALGGVIAFVVLFAVWWFYPRGMGFGDVRLAGLTGSALGWLGLLHVYVGFLVAFVAGALFGAGLMVLRGTGRKTKMPFAPALALGAVVGVLWGQPLVNVLVQHHT